MLKNTLSRLVLTSLIAFHLINSYPQQNIPETDMQWVDSVFRTLKLEEQISQLIIVDSYSDRDINHEAELTSLIRNNKIGGLFFHKGSPSKQVVLSDFYQSQSKIPLIMAMNPDPRPGNLTMAAVKNDSLIYMAGKEQGRKFCRLGIQLCLTEATDTWSKKKEGLYIMAMQSEKIFYDTTLSRSLAAVKEPEKITDHILSSVNYLVSSPQNVNKLIAGIKNAVFSGQISRQVLEKQCRKALAAKASPGFSGREKINEKELLSDLNNTGSRILIRKLLKESITVLNNYGSIIPVKNLGTCRIASLSIGDDKLPHYYKMLDKYSRIDHYDWDPETQDFSDLLRSLEGYDLLITGISLSGCKDHNLQPVYSLISDSLSIIQDSLNTIISIFGEPFILNDLHGIDKAGGLLLTYEDSRLAQEMAAQLIFGAIAARGSLPLNINKNYTKGYGLETNELSRLGFAIPEEVGLDSKKLNNTIDSIAMLGLNAGAYPGCQVLVARNGKIVLHKTYGYHTYENRNPVNKNDIYDFASVTKITGTLPALMRLVDEGKIDIDDKLSKYWPDFKHSNKSELSIREILAHQSGMIPYIKFWEKTLKKNGTYKTRIFKHDSSEKFCDPVAAGLYMNKNYRKKMYKEIKRSPVSEEKKYVYSGLSFYLYPQIIENLSGSNYETYVKTNIYRPLGAYSLTYTPSYHFPLQQIIPTEYDSFFRHMQLHGYVHDEGAAMMGGVSGNAGLFGKAVDLAKLMDMYLNMGYYGDKQFISEKTMREFTAYQYPDNNNRRGLGFDKPKVNNRELPAEEQYPTGSVSASSFGHSGYTGTFTWVDPEEQILLVFLSNRVYPTRNNSLLYKMNIRPAILESIYSSIIQ